MERHLRTNHKAIPLTIRKELVDFIKGLTLISVGELVLPDIPVPTLEYLDIVDGLSCEALYGMEHSIKWHCRSAHGKVLTESMSNL